MTTRYLDPRITNIFMDSCAFDPKYYPENEASDKLFQLKEAGELNLIIAHSNQKEIDHPNTPKWVKREAQYAIYTIKTNLINDEEKAKEDILCILSGSGKQENMRQDADHLFEASKYGASYFVTTDKKILKKGEELFKQYQVNVLLPSELLAIHNQYTNE